MKGFGTLLLLGAAGALALDIAACEFDQTQVPPLPDDVLHFGQQGSGGGGGEKPGGIEGDCERDEPVMADFGPSEGVLTGTWARRLILRSERDTRNTGEWKDSSWTVYERVRVSHQGTVLREVVEVCDLWMDTIDGANTGFPDALLASLPVLAEEGEFLTEETPGETVGSAYKNLEPLVRLYGLDPAAAGKEWAPCASYFNPANLKAECPLALWPEIVDMDCDGNVGVTLDMTVGTAATEQVYMIQRDAMTRSGAVESADRITGGITYEENNANLGSTKAMLKSNPPSRVVDGSTFVMVRLQDGDGCEAVRGAAYDE